MKPTPRLIRRRLTQAYSAILSVSGIPMVVSGGLVLALSLAVATEYGHELGIFATAFVVALGIAYCVPWCAVTDPVSAEEEPFL